MTHLNKVVNYGIVDEGLYTGIMRDEIEKKAEILEKAKVKNLSENEREKLKMDLALIIHKKIKERPREQFNMKRQSLKRIKSKT